MINDQIILWITRNQEIYLQGGFKDKCMKAANVLKVDGVRQLFKNVMIKLFELMEEELKQNSAVEFEKIATFYVLQNKVEKQYIPKYCLDLKLKKLIASSQSSRVQSKKNSDLQDLYKKVGAILLVQTEIVIKTVNIFGTAVIDLVKSSKKVQIDCKFCKILIEKSKFICCFRLSFKSQLNGNVPKVDKKTQIKRRYLCQRSINLEQTKDNQMWDQHWNELKQGYLFNYPSVIEIKNHLNKGLELQLKYRSIMDKYDRSY